MDSSARKYLHHSLLSSCASTPRHCTTLITVGKVRHGTVTARLTVGNLRNLHSIEEYTQSFSHCERSLHRKRACVRARCLPTNGLASAPRQLLSYMVTFLRCSHLHAGKQTPAGIAQYIVPVCYHDPPGNFRQARFTLPICNETERR